jgi:hypothetical protein
MSVEAFARRQLPLLASAFAGISMIVGYFFAPVAGQLQSDVNRFASPVIAAGFGIGYIGLMIQHIRRLVRMEKDWELSIVCLIFMNLPFIGFIDPQHSIYLFLSQHVWNGIMGMMVGLMGYFVASASVRAFRARNVDAAILLISFAAVIIGQNPMLENATTLAVKDFFLDILHGAGIRAVGMALTVGSFAYTVRLWLGMERAALGEAEITA